MSTVINHLTLIFKKLHYDNLMTVLTFYIYVSTNICLLDCNKFNLKLTIYKTKNKYGMCTHTYTCLLTLFELSLFKRLVWP